MFRDDKRNDTSIVLHKQVIEAGKGRRKLSNTFLDILLVLIQLSKDNQNFVMFVLRNLHSGFNKINWTRTIGRNTTIVQDDSPIYLNVVNKKRQFNFDEKGDLRLTESLSNSDNYLRCYPDYMQGMWKDLAHELRCYGGNTIANIFSKGYGPSYESVVCSVCKHMRVSVEHTDTVAEMEEKYFKRRIHTTSCLLEFKCVQVEEGV